MTADFDRPPVGSDSESKSPIETYNRLKERILGCIGSTLALDPPERQACVELEEKVRANTFNLVVVGQFKRGKTCLINALLGADILPVSVVPLTSIVTVVAYGEQVGGKVCFNDGRVREITRGALAEYVTESGNPKNEKNVREVTVTFPSSYLKDGVRLVDTPGVGSVYLHNTDIAYRYLPKSDAALFLLSVDQPASRAELDFLADVRQFSDKIFFLLNKTDYLSDGEIAEAVSFSRAALEETMGQPVRIFPVSAKLALSAKLEGSPGLLQKSMLPEFSGVLDSFLLEEKGRTLVVSFANDLLRILSLMRLEAELQMKSLTAPVEEIREKTGAFERKKDELLRERQDFDVLFHSEVDRLVRKELEKDLDALKRRFVPEMEREFGAFYESNKDLTLKELNDALEGFVAERVERTFTAWQEIEDEKLAGAFQEVCNRFAAKVNGIVDALLRYSSQLFSIPFEPVAAESLWTAESGFYYKMREDMVGLDMLAQSLAQVFPLYISSRFQRLKAYVYNLANRVILSKRKRQMLETIEMQSGRLRHDFIERLNRSAHRFRAGMIDKIEAATRGVVKAIEQGVELRSRGEEEARKLESGLAEKLRSIERIREELAEILDGARRQ